MSITPDEQATIDTLAEQGWVLAHHGPDVWRFERLGVGAGVQSAIGPTLERATQACLRHGPPKTHPGVQDSGTGSAGGPVSGKDH